MRVVVLSLFFACCALFAFSPCQAADLERQLNFILVNPGESASASLGEYDSESSLAALRELSAAARGEVSLSSQEVQKCSDQIMATTAERDYLLALMMKKLLLEKNPNLAAEIVDALEERCEVARAKYFVSTMELADLLPRD